MPFFHFIHQDIEFPLLLQTVLVFHGRPDADQVDALYVTIGNPDLLEPPLCQLLRSLFYLLRYLASHFHLLHLNRRTVVSEVLQLSANAHNSFLVSTTISRAAQLLGAEGIFTMQCWACSNVLSFYPPESPHLFFVSTMIEFWRATLTSSRSMASCRLTPASFSRMWATFCMLTRQFTLSRKFKYSAKPLTSCDAGRV